MRKDYNNRAREQNRKEISNRLGVILTSKLEEAKDRKQTRKAAVVCKYEQIAWEVGKNQHKKQMVRQ